MSNRGMTGVKMQRSPSAQYLLRVLGFALFASGCAAVLLLLVRRLAGELASPLPAALLLLTGVALVSWAEVLRRLVTLNGSLETERTWRIVSPTILLLAAASLTLPGTDGLALAMFWCLLGGAAAWQTKDLWMPLFRAKQRPFPKNLVPEPKAFSNAALLDSASEEDEGFDPLVMQHVERRLHREGGEEISGWVRAHLPAGQRGTAAHVAFCPPLAASPICDFEQADGPAARIKLGQLLPVGARFDVHLEHAQAEPADVIFEFSARTNDAAGSRPSPAV